MTESGFWFLVTLKPRVKYVLKIIYLDFLVKIGVLWRGSMTRHTVAITPTSHQNQHIVVFCCILLHINSLLVTFKKCTRIHVFKEMLNKWQYHNMLCDRCHNFIYLN